MLNQFIMFHESQLRSVIKTITWRVLATATTTILVLVFSGKISVALLVGGLEAFLKLILYYLHERGWDRIRFGRSDLRPRILWIDANSGTVSDGSGGDPHDLGRQLVERLVRRGLRAEHLDADGVAPIITAAGASDAGRVAHLARRFQNQGVFTVVTYPLADAASHTEVATICQSHFEIVSRKSTADQIAESIFHPPGRRAG